MLDQAQLTERERVAAILLAYGHTNRDVARELRVSVRTIESERARIMLKLSASTTGHSSCGGRSSRASFAEAARS